jgi:endonuclease/exonuclease/phosphatase family metal-dependent hydrolase
MTTAHSGEQSATSEPDGVDLAQVVRVATYNIHSCVDGNRNVNLDMIAGILDEVRADIVALQEVDGRNRLSRGRNQASILAEKLGMDHIFFAAEKTGLRAFGLAIFSRYEFDHYHCNYLPSLYPILKPRKRAAIRAGIKTPMGLINIINVHLSLFKLERRMQLNALLGKEWLAAMPGAEPVVLCGDLNAGPFSGTYRTLSRRLTDVQKDAKQCHSTPLQPTFHARSPLFRIDHIFISPHFETVKVEVKKTSDTRIASDHLPLIADLRLFRRP